ncbi:MAG: alanine racemase, partial [Campylobacterota bacterium]|nr:alanine racemase [Campylobacterota bacterium]
YNSLMAFITLNKKHFFNNLDIISKRSKAKDKIALVLKDNAYGHGLLEIAVLAKEYGIKRAVVQTQEEAKSIEGFFEYLLVLADIPKEQSEKIRYTINDINAVEKFAKNTKVELKVNTGMNRNGIEMQELEAAFEAIEKQGLRLEAVFTHHGCADELNGLYEIQNENFEKVKRSARELALKHGFGELRFHSCNSAAFFRESAFDEDMARVGIAAYGCMQLPAAFDEEDLKPVLSLYANKVSTRSLKKGAAVGYGAAFVADEDCVVSNYDFGYGDGFLRACSKAYKTPENVKLLGRISMDNSSFMSSEDELLIFSDARDVAEMAGTISYEVLTSLKAKIKREII